MTFSGIYGPASEVIKQMKITDASDLRIRPIKFDSGSIGIKFAYAMVLT
jgi:hypothetical protein